MSKSIKSSVFISKEFERWAYENKIALDYSRPGRPTDNPIIESFNGSLRDECLNMNWFLSLEGLTPDEVEFQKAKYPEFSSLGWS